MAVNHVWMRYPDTGGVARFPERSAPVWQARGWELCEAPADPEPRADPRLVDAEVIAAESAKASKTSSAGKSPTKKSPATPDEKEGASRG